MQPMEKCNINFIFLLLCHFLIISAENVHHYALHRDAHDESCQRTSFAMCQLISCPQCAECWPEALAVCVGDFNTQYP
jgi:hypothetical protein